VVHEWRDRGFDRERRQHTDNMDRAVGRRRVNGDTRRPLWVSLAALAALVIRLPARQF
jgi:hypothetical protein